MRLIIVLLCLLAAPLYAEGLRNRFGIYTNGQTLATGRVAVSTNSPVGFYVGNATSNAVLVGSDSWSNNVTASVTNGLAHTNYVNTAVANRAVTNAWNTMTLAITNAPPTGTNLVLWTDDATNLYWKAWP